MKQRSGIYKIENSVSGKAYVGSASDLNSRRRTHFNTLKRGVHMNIKLQNAWNKYGPDAFLFIVIEYVQDRNDLRPREQFWMDHLRAVSSGYNIKPSAFGQLGYKMSDATKAKIAACQFGRVPSAETRKKISDAKKGSVQSLEQRKRHSEFMTGRKPSEGHLAAQVAAIQSPEVRAKISIAGKGRKFTEEHKGKLRAAANTPEAKAQRANRIPTTGNIHSPATKLTLSEKAKLRWADPVQREKFTIARRARVSAAML